VNVLDENILDSQRLMLRSWRIRTRQIGIEIGRKGLTDNEVISVLLAAKRPTFFTRDDDFDDSDLCHKDYSLIVLKVRPYDAAHFIRLTLRHPQADSFEKRRGKVMRVSPTGITVFEKRKPETHYLWRK
jgi:hypothetical protein